jgi:alkyl hydroperoxide reductase subunit AhpC
VLRLGNIVPDFTAMTTQGEIHWHDWIDGKWAILFSHPADFTCAFTQTCCGMEMRRPPDGCLLSDLVR